VLTDRRQAARPLADVVAAAVEGGARAVVLRERDLPAPERAALADSLAALLAPVGGTLILASPPTGRAGAVHLRDGEPMPEPRPVLVGRSCHGWVDESVDYVTVSPVFPSTSKPGYGPCLGVDGLSRLCRRTGKPVYALGGVESPAAAGACVRAGAAGVAVMGAVMRADDPARVVAALLEALGP